MSTSTYRLKTFFGFIITRERDQKWYCNDEIITAAKKKVVFKKIMSGEPKRWEKRALHTEIKDCFFIVIEKCRREKDVWSKRIIFGDGRREYELRRLRRVYVDQKKHNFKVILCVPSTKSHHRCVMYVHLVNAGIIITPALQPWIPWEIISQEFVSIAVWVSSISCIILFWKVKKK